jgi:hypothetical protein
MLWNAGQTRVSREGHDRLAELFVAARDAALDVLVSTGQAKPKGTWSRPPYIEATPPPPPRTAALADRDAMLAQLGAMFPGARRVQ